MFCVIFHAFFGNMFFTVLLTVVHPCHLSISHNSSMAAVTLICDATGGGLNGHDEKVRLSGLGRVFVETWPPCWHYGWAV